MNMESPIRSNVSRISISLPEELLAELDSMVVERGFNSRSSAIGDMIHQSLMEHKSQRGTDLMAGVITLVYDNTTKGLKKKISDLQYQYIDEVISSLHVHMLHNHTMEVMLVQGPAGKLHQIADEMISCRGVKSGRVNLVAALIPQIHPFTGERA